MNSTLDRDSTAKPAKACTHLWRIRTAIAAAMACASLVACGGGGGPTNVAAAAPTAVVLQVTVRDAFDAPVAGATVAGSGTTSTDERGVAYLFVDPAVANVNVTVSRTTFADALIAVPISGNVVNTLALTIQRTTSAAGGSLASRGATLPVIDESAQQMTFEIELVVVDGNSLPIEGLSLANFSLSPCAPAAAKQPVNCIHGARLAGDVAYAPTSAAPTGLQLIAANPVKPFAAGLLMDQSGSIAQSDASGARLYSAKAFLRSMGADDRVLLAAFAGGPGAIIPTVPSTVYQSFADRASVRSLFATLDSLTRQVGGNTPLYDAVDTLRGRIANDTSLPVGMAKAVVLFSDGADTSCASDIACRARRAEVIAQASSAQVRLFTIGLSKDIDVAALGELANQTGGAFLYADSAEQLLPLYGSVGKLLSLGLPTYRLRWTVRADAPGVFQSGSSLLGRVQVTAGTHAFNVPFIVGVP